MAKKDRTGNKKTRNKHFHQRIPEMGYYLIVTDTEATERCYFNGLYNSLPNDIKNKLVIKVVETKTGNLIQKCLDLVSYDPQYRIPWIVFDRDKVTNFDNIINNAQKENINIGWSNPCFEIWLYAYFGIMPNIQESWICCSKFSELYKQKTKHEYSKSDDNLYNILYNYGDEKKAIELANQKLIQCIKNGKSQPSQMVPSTTVFQLVKEKSQQ